MLLKLSLILATVLFIVILVVKRFVYFQPSYIFEQARDTYQDVYEGYLHAWYRKGKSGKVFLFCHGNAGNVSYRQQKLIALTNMGHSVLIFDYSGYGQSKGVPNEEMCYANADVYYSYLLRIGYKPANIIPYGESMGAAVATYIARKYSLPLLVIESGLTSMKDVISRHLPFFLRFLTTLFPEFDTVKYLTGYRGKVCVIHAQDDEIVPLSSAQKLLSLATLPIVMTGSHNTNEIPWQEIEKFVA